HGTIVAMSSVAGMRVRRSNFVYGASKAGTDGFYVNLNEALRGSGANVVVVRPGQVSTKMSADAGEAPLTVDVDDVANATVKAVLAGKGSVFVRSLFQYVSLAFKFIPQTIFRRLPFEKAPSAETYKLILRRSLTFKAASIPILGSGLKQGITRMYGRLTP